MQLTSSEFQDGDPIPKKYTCQGEDISPPLTWQEVPPQAKSLALSLIDPDAPGGEFKHWLIYNMSAEDGSISEGETPEGMLVQNDFAKEEYGGPCPPSGQHRYVFTVYALEDELRGVIKENFQEQVEDLLIEKTQLTSFYEKE